MFRFDLPKIKQFLPQWRGPAADMLVRMMAAFVMHMGKMTATQMAGAVRSQPRHRANVGRFLARHPSLQDGRLLNRTARRMIQRETQRHGTWLLILDQTYVGHQSTTLENTFSRGNKRPRQKKSQRKQLQTTRHSCHAFVIGLIITPSGCRIPLMQSYYTRAYAEQIGQPFRTQAVIAADLIRSAPLPVDVPVLVLGDTAYEAQTVRRACDERGWKWIVPINPERVLNEAKPRRKLTALVEDIKLKDWTPLRFTANQGTWAAQQRVAACRRGSIKHTRSYYAHRELRNVLHVGQVALVFSMKKKPPRGPSVSVDKILMTNDLRLSCRAVAEAYALRWQVELLFRELKSTLGFDHYSFREYAKVDGWINVCLLSFALLEWQRQSALRDRKLSDQARRWWERQRTHGLCCAVRQQVEVRDLQRIEQGLQTPSGLKRLRKLLKNSYPSEYQAV